MPTALTPKSILPGLTVDDLGKSIAFYEALGFSVAQRWEQDGKLMSVMMKAGEFELGLNEDDWKKGRDRQKGLGTRLNHRDGAEHRRDRGANEGRWIHARHAALRHPVEDAAVRADGSHRIQVDGLERVATLGALLAA